MSAFREAIISVLTERALLRRSLNSADAELRTLISRRCGDHRDTLELRALISRRCGDHRDTLRLDLSLVAFLGKQKVAMGVYKGAKSRYVGNTARISTTHVFLSV